MDYKCHCSCGEEHEFASYHHHIETDSILWFSSKVHRDNWKAKQFGMDLSKKAVQTEIPLGSYY